MDQLIVKAIRAAGRHGVAAGEKDKPQPFEVDLNLELDTSAASVSDDLSDTVDYADLAAAAARVVTAESHDLIETLAERVAQVALADGRVNAVEVEVRKLAPRMSADVAYAAVRIRRER